MELRTTGFKILLSFICIGVIFISACQTDINTSFEESVEPYLELEAIDNSGNTVITVNRGDVSGLDSYFAFNLNNTPDHGLVRAGLTEGWCLEWNKAIAQNNDTHGGVAMYSTEGSSTWKPANYLMTIRKELQAEDPALTYREIQVALWSLIETPAFNLDEALANGTMPSRMLLNGEPIFDVQKVRSITNRVRQEVSDFTYSPDKPFLVFARTDDGQQNGGIVTCSAETAWADGTRFNQQGGNWATYTSYNGIEKTITLYAGQTIDIGTVTFKPENGNVKITIELNQYGEFQNVQENVKIQDYSTAPSGNPQIGQFDHKGTAGGKSFSTTVPSNSFYAVHVDAKGCE
ncbi:hypothetical protein [Rhodohalobacter sp. 8-1]|uniref:hypothetical protein n=1 Tax=Rhodohalobacter sp. 8-1 TaxID=3131972 RepID=UPI0030ED3590